jgi:glutaredoxin
MITLYSTHCPQCSLLERQLKQKNIQFEICDDVAKMLSFGFSSAPILEVDGTFMKFADALKWVKEK